MKLNARDLGLAEVSDVTAGIKALDVILAKD